MAKTYSTSEVAKILGVSNSKLYYAVREMNLEVDTDHRGDRLFTDEDIALLKQAFSIVESGGTYKQAYNHLVQGDIIEVDHTPPKQFNEQNLKEFIQVITKELAKSNQEMQEQTIKAISENTQSYKDNTKEMQELKDEIKNLKAEIKELKNQEPESKGLLAKLFGK